MKKTIVSIILTIICITFSSCNNKQAALDHFEEFTEEITQNGHEYSTEEWDNAEIQYEELTDELDQYEYSSAEKRKINRLKAKYMAAYAKRKVGDVMDIFDQVKGAINEFQDNDK